jgi:hypothetical protein
MTPYAVEVMPDGIHHQQREDHSFRHHNLVLRMSVVNPLYDRMLYNCRAAACAAGRFDRT